MKDQNTMEVFERIYQNALLLAEGRLYSEAADEFARIPDYKDAAQRKEECRKLAEAERKDAIYAEADKAAGNPNVRSQEKAIKLFETIPGWRDADERIREAHRRIGEIIVKERADRQDAIRAAEYEQQVTAKRKKRMKRLITAAAASVAAVLVGVFLFRNVVSPAMKYAKAVKLIEAEQPEEAYELLHELDFLDSGKMVRQIAQNRLSDAEIGSTVQFGFYPQAGRSSDEKDIIEWIVLDKDSDKMLLISKYALDCLPYQSAVIDQYTGSWEVSQVRSWLNDSFLNEAFDKEEAQLLVSTVLSGSSDTDNDLKLEDKVFLLSVSEAETYFPDNEARKCLATRYAIYHGAYQSSIGRTCFWWLRNTRQYTDLSLEGMPRETFTRAALVGSSGRIVDIGHYMFNQQYVVRPVIWVDIHSNGALQQAGIN